MHLTVGMGQPLLPLAFSHSCPVNFCMHAVHAGSLHLLALAVTSPTDQLVADPFLVLHREAQITDLQNCSDLSCLSASASPNLVPSCSGQIQPGPAYPGPSLSNLGCPG